MKIKIGNTLLNESGQQPKNFSFSERRQLQTEFAIGAQKARVLDRGNGKSYVEFSLERAHESEAEAEAFALTHCAELSALLPADMSFTFEDALGKCAAEFKLAGAIPENIKIQSDGLLTSTSYAFSAQNIERTIP